MEVDSKISVLQHFATSEDHIDRFLRGEGPLEFRSTFEIDPDTIEMSVRHSDGRAIVEDEAPSSTSQFLVIKGVATTSNRDDNGVDVLPSALRSLPDDFNKRRTVLFNHDSDWPIGKMAIDATRYVNSKPNAYVSVDPVLIDTDSRALDGVRFVDKIERGILRTFSIGWATRDGVIAFSNSEEKKITLKELQVLGLTESEISDSFRFGTNNSPRILVKSLVGIELSVVSAPADADAEFATSSFSRHLGNALYKFGRSKSSSILVPQTFEIADFHADCETIVVTEDPADVRLLGGFSSNAPWDPVSASARVFPDGFLVPVYPECLCAQGNEFPHHDMRNGVLYSNLIAILQAAHEIEERNAPQDYIEACSHLRQELVEIHEYLEDDLPSVLRVIPLDNSNLEGGEVE